MHAPDWRERYKNDLQRSLPRIPLAADFEAFRAAGRELMDLHIGYESCPEDMSITCLVRMDDNSKVWLEVIDHHDGLLMLAPWQRLAIGDDPDTVESALLRITSKKMRLNGDETMIEISPRCRLVNIPPRAKRYTVSGSSPLEVG